jgi:hypothetical protein
MQIGAAVSIAAFGTLYLGRATQSTGAFGVTVTALLAALTAYRATRQAPTGSHQETETLEAA